MTDTTPEDKFYTAKKREIYLRWLLIVVTAVFVFLWIRGYKEGEDAAIAYKAIQDTLQSVLDDTARVHGEARRLKHENADRDLHIADLVADLQATRGALIDESDKASRLSFEVKKAKANKDTVRYYEKCDSLADQNRIKNNHIIDLVKKYGLQENAYQERIRNADSLSKHLEFSYDSCKNAVKFAKTELPKIKPKGRVCAVVTGVVDGGILGIGGGFTYISPNSILIGVKGYATNLGSLYTVEFGVPLNFKRK